MREGADLVAEVGEELGVHARGGLLDAAFEVHQGVDLEGALPELFRPAMGDALRDAERLHHLEHVRVVVGGRDAAQERGVSHVGQEVEARHVGGPVERRRGAALLRQVP